MDGKLQKRVIRIGGVWLSQPIRTVCKGRAEYQTSPRVARMRGPPDIQGGSSGSGDLAGHLLKPALTRRTQTTEEEVQEPE